MRFQKSWSLWVATHKTLTWAESPDLSCNRSHCYYGFLGAFNRMWQHGKILEIRWDLESDQPFICYVALSRWLNLSEPCGSLPQFQHYQTRSVAHLHAPLHLCWLLFNTLSYTVPLSISPVPTGPKSSLGTEYCHLCVLMPSTGFGKEQKRRVCVGGKKEGKKDGGR